MVHIYFFAVVYFLFIKALDGREIYSNCCLLKIVYSTEVGSLNVRFNNDKMRDFTKDLPPGPNM
jgi:hypothetical protein